MFFRGPLVFLDQALRRARRFRAQSAFYQPPIGTVVPTRTPPQPTGIVVPTLM